MDPSQYAYDAYNGQYNYLPGYPAQYAQQQYQAPPPQIRNPFAPPPSLTPSAYSAQNANFDPEYEQQVAAWQSTYADPVEQLDRGRKGGKQERSNHSNGFPSVGPAFGSSADTGDHAAPANPEEKKQTVVRKGGGEQWEDKTLLEWDPTQFRIMVGNLAGEVTDDSLAKAFAAYGVSKARVIRDKRTTKSKGYGFVSFTDGEAGFKAAREMVGKYIGSHPVTIERSRTNVTPVVTKDHNKHRNKNKHSKGRTNTGRDTKHDLSGNGASRSSSDQKAQDPLKARTGAHIVKKPVKNPHAGLKLLG